MNKKYKLALGLGTVATVVAPIATVVACGDGGNKDASAISRHAFDFSTDLRLFVDATSTLDDTEVAALSGAKTTAEMGYAEPKLSAGTTATYSITNDVVTVTLHNGGDDSSPKTFNLHGVPSFDFTNDLALFADASSTLKDVEVEAMNGLKTAVQLGYTMPTGLSTGTTVEFTAHGQSIRVVLRNGPSKSLPKDFVLKGIPTIIRAHQYSGLLDVSFTMPSTITTVEFDAFKDATLPKDFIWSATNLWGDPLPGATLVSAYVAKIEAAIKIVESRKLPVDKVLNDALDAAKHRDNSLAKQIEYLEPYASGPLQNKILPSWFSIAQGTTSIGDEFKGTTLPVGFTLPSSLTSIGNHAFEGATLPVGFAIPQGVTSIGEYVFSKATLPAGFTIPEGVKTIGKFAFEGTTLSAGFAIPSSVTSIDGDAFNGTTLPAGFTIPPRTIHSLREAFSKSKLATGYMWSTKRGYLGMPTDGSSVVQIHIDSNATSINEGEFVGVTLPAGFTIPQGVTRIDSRVFMGATLPAGFAIPHGVEYIGDEAFRGATLPAGFTISSSVIIIGSDAFREVTLPTGFTIPQGVEYIYSAAFNGATLPAGFTISQSVKDIAAWSFNNAKLPAGFTIPSSVFNIEASAFSGAILPAGYVWSKLDSNGKPFQGSSVIQKP